MTTPIERAREAALQMADDRLDRTKIGAALALFLDSLADDGLALVPKEALIQASRAWRALNPPEPELPDYMQRRYRRVVSSPSPHHMHKQQSNKPEAGEEG